MGVGGTLSTQAGFKVRGEGTANLYTRGNERSKELPWTRVVFPPEDACVDSPAVRERFRGLYENVESYSQKMKKLVKAARRMQHSGQGFLADLGEFVAQMNHLGERESVGPMEDGTYLEAIQTFATTLDQIRELLDIQTGQVAQVFADPMETMLKTDVVKLRELFKKYEKAKSSFDACSNRWSSLKTRDTAKIEECQMELAVLEKQHQEAAVELAASINRFQAHKSITVLDRFCALMYSQMIYFQKGNDYFHQMDPFLKSTSTHIQEYRTRFRDQSTLTASQLQRRSARPPVLGPQPPSALTIEGYLFKKGKNVMQPWQRRYFCIQNGFFIAYKTGGEKREARPVPVINLLLCTVKIVPDPDRRFCFELVSPIVSYMLQAQSQEEMMAWITVIQNGIQAALDQQQSKRASESPAAGGRQAGNSAMARLQAFNESCRVCAECGDTNPCWASIMLGVTFCIECSGIHRAMGVHISKVRSLTLDDWSDSVLGVLMSIGNSISNQVFEGAYHPPEDPSTAPDYPIKPAPRADRATRERFILAKYKDKMFVQRNEEPNLNAQLWNALKFADIRKICQLVAQGADLSARNPENGQYPMHIAVERGNVILTEYLFQNSAKINVQDLTMATPLHYATQFTNIRMCAWLFERGADLTLKNAAGQTPADLAVSLQAADAVTLLRLASLQIDEEKDAQMGSKTVSSLSQALGSLLGKVSTAEEDALVLRASQTPFLHGVPIRKVTIGSRQH